MSKKALLMILDGWGIGNHSHADVIYNTPTPYWDYLLKTYPHSQLQASGENVGGEDQQSLCRQFHFTEQRNCLCVLLCARQR